MFTGIVEGVGQVAALEDFKTHRRIRVKCPFSLSESSLGDSIAIDGCCLTVTDLSDNSFSADVSPETLRVTTLGDIKEGSRVNLERPMCLGDRLGGHLVQGHVDGVGDILSSRLVETEPTSYFLIKIRVPESLSKYMVSKGAISVDGISLTVNEVQGTEVSLFIIPHTQVKTTLTGKKAGDKINIEADILLKFVEQRLGGVWEQLKSKGLKVPS